MGRFFLGRMFCLRGVFVGGGGWLVRGFQGMDLEQSEVVLMGIGYRSLRSFRGGVLRLSLMDYSKYKEVERVDQGGVRKAQ